MGTVGLEQDGHWIVGDDDDVPGHVWLQLVGYDETGVDTQDAYLRATSGGSMADALRAMADEVEGR